MSSPLVAAEADSIEETAHGRVGGGMNTQAPLYYGKHRRRLDADSSLQDLAPEEQPNRRQRLATVVHNSVATPPTTQSTPLSTPAGKRRGSLTAALPATTRNGAQTQTGVSASATVVGGRQRIQISANTVTKPPPASTSKLISAGSRPTFNGQPAGFNNRSAALPPTRPPPVTTARLQQTTPQPPPSSSASQATSSGPLTEITQMASPRNGRGQRRRYSQIGLSSSSSSSSSSTSTQSPSSAFSFSQEDQERSRKRPRLEEDASDVDGETSVLSSLSTANGSTSNNSRSLVSTGRRAARDSETIPATTQRGGSSRRSPFSSPGSLFSPRLRRRGSNAAVETVISPVNTNSAADAMSVESTLDTSVQNDENIRRALQFDNEAQNENEYLVADTAYSTGNDAEENTAHEQQQQLHTLPIHSLDSSPAASVRPYHSSPSPSSSSSAFPSTTLPSSSSSSSSSSASSSDPFAFPSSYNSFSSAYPASLSSSSASTSTLSISLLSTSSSREAVNRDVRELLQRELMRPIPEEEYNRNSNTNTRRMDGTFSSSSLQSPALYRQTHAFSQHNEFYQPTSTKSPPSTPAFPSRPSFNNSSLAVPTSAKPQSAVRIPIPSSPMLMRSPQKLPPTALTAPLSPAAQPLSLPRPASPLSAPDTSFSFSSSFHVLFQLMPHVPQYIIFYFVLFVSFCVCVLFQHFLTHLFAFACHWRMHTFHRSDYANTLLGGFLHVTHTSAAWSIAFTAIFGAALAWILMKSPKSLTLPVAAILPVLSSPSEQSLNSPLASTSLSASALSASPSIALPATPAFPKHSLFVFHFVRCASCRRAWLLFILLSFLLEMGIHHFFAFDWVFPHICECIRLGMNVTANVWTLMAFRLKHHKYHATMARE